MAGRFLGRSFVARLMAEVTMDQKWSINKLDGSNWTTWKFQMRYLLLVKELWGYVDGTEVLGEGATAQVRVTEVSESILHNRHGDLLLTVVPDHLS